jgi:hypothetical protein
MASTSFLKAIRLYGDVHVLRAVVGDQPRAVNVFVCDEERSVTVGEVGAQPLVVIRRIRIRAVLEHVGTGPILLEHSVLPGDVGG